jgi:hypothetical protein
MNARGSINFLGHRNFLEEVIVKFPGDTEEEFARQ